MTLTPAEVLAVKERADEQAMALRVLADARTNLQRLQKMMPPKPLDGSLTATLTWGRYPDERSLPMPYEIARKLLLTHAQGRLQRALSRCHLLGIAP